MRNTIVFALAFVFVVAINDAVHAEGVYFSGQGGVTFLEDADNKGGGVVIESNTKTGFNAGGAIGYKFNENFRAEVEASYKRNDLDTLRVTQSPLGFVTGTPVDTEGDITSRSVLANIIWDFVNSSQVTPYVMGGAGIANIDLNDVRVGSILFSDDDATVFAYQFGGGVEVAASKTVGFFLDYKLFGTSDPELKDSAGFDFESEVFSHNISAGIRIYLSPRERVAKRGSAGKTRRVRSAPPPPAREATIYPRPGADSEPGDSTAYFVRETQMQKDKRECAAITFPEDDHIPPYSARFLACMKSRGWVPKK